MTKRAGTWIRMQLNIYIVEDVHSILAETYEHIDWTYTYQIENIHTTRFGMWLKHVRTTQDSNGWTSFDLGPLKASWLRQENTGKVPKKSVPVTLSTARPRMSKRKVLRVIWRILIDVCADRWGNSWNSWMGRWCLLAQYIDDKLCLQINDMWYSAPVSWGLWQKNDVKEGTPKWWDVQYPPVKGFKCIQQFWQVVPKKLEPLLHDLLAERRPLWRSCWTE